MKMQCAQCGSSSVSVRCTHCKRVFCGAECAEGSEFLRYRDTNYIDGTHLDFTICRETHCVTNAKGETLFLFNDLQIIGIFRLLDLSHFHQRTPDDRPQCCDQPYRVIEYGKHMVASIESVPKLAAAMLKAYEETDAARRAPKLQQSRMRSFTSMKG